MFGDNPSGRTVYLLLVPAAPGPGEASRFLPIPPSNLGGVANDLEWTFPVPDGSIAFEHFNQGSGRFEPVQAASLAWKIK